MTRQISGDFAKLSGNKVLGSINAIIIAFMTLILNGCDSGMASPKGPIAAAELNLTFFSIKLMLLVVIPVILMACWFGWRYREGNNAKYTPEWTHSTALEIVWWSIPIIIILILGTVTWRTTHSLDPYKPLDSNVKPVTIEVVSLDWKWLFIYPEYKVATINYLKIPANTPINFKITAASPMNSFIIPQLGGQIYAMTGMETKLHLQADETGHYRGFAANYTGMGFAKMNFDTVVTERDDFENWVDSVKKSPLKLTSDTFWGQIMPSSTNVPVTDFGSVDEGLFDSIIKHYMMPDMN